MSSYRSSQGRAAETQLMTSMAEEGWTVASRRHVPGPGDILASKLRYDLMIMGEMHVYPIVWLIEVKTTAGGPFERFGPADREALRACAHAAGALAWLAWRKYPSEPWTWLSEDLWPLGRVRKVPLLP